jgi:hypothetical protein
MVIFIYKECFTNSGQGSVLAYRRTKGKMTGFTYSSHLHIPVCEVIVAYLEPKMPEMFVSVGVASEDALFDSIQFMSETYSTCASAPV